MCDFWRRAKVTSCRQRPGSEFPDWAADAEDVIALSVAAIDSKQPIHLSGIWKTYTSFFSDVTYETWAGIHSWWWDAARIQLWVSWTHLLAGDGGDGINLPFLLSVPPANCSNPLSGFRWLISFLARDWEITKALHLLQSSLWKG